MNTVLIPISIGALFDKISILQIKIERIADQVKRSDCRKELDLLNK
ncbi:MAG: hypothetical protein MI975_27410 [Cytophagales bacterium]|nr:hypothetical protein [Cytophagales bacterium]